MNPTQWTGSQRVIAIARRQARRGSEPPVYRAGEEAAPGVYRDLERGITVRLAGAMRLPDLNSYQPSRFFRENDAHWLLARLWQPSPSIDKKRLYLAGQRVPAGKYRDVERGILVELRGGGLLPDLQSGEPSRYRRVRAGGVRVRTKAS
jgi:hypothetical protein